MTPYIRSQNSITVLIDGMPNTVPAGTTQYEKVEAALEAQDEAALRLAVAPARELVEKLAQYGDVEIFSGHVKFRGQELNNYLVDVILRTDDQEPVARFLDNVLQNPSRRAVQDLYKWCEASNLPITLDGCIVAYKIVREDFFDQYSGTFDNSPGNRVEMPRNQVDENPNNTCSDGLHFASAKYLPHYASSGKVVLVKVNPRDVVAFPIDYHLGKARCCGYDVIKEIPPEKAKTFFDDHTGFYETETETEELVFIRDTRDGDYVVDGPDGYLYAQDEPVPISRSAAEELLTHEIDCWVIVPVSENDDWSPSSN